MSASGTFGKRALAVCAAAALGLGGLLVASPASANSQPAELAPTEGAAYEAFAKGVLVDNSNIQVVGKDANGEISIVAVAKTEDDKKAVDKAVAAYENVASVRYISEPLTAYADTDVVGGAGYFTAEDGATSGSVCSIGFTAWDGSGNDAVISAGHCTSDGTLENTALTVPSLDVAGGNIDTTYPLGTFGFSQFGGPGNTPGADGDKNSIDVSVIDVTNGDLTLKPEITDWTTAAENDLSLSTTKVTAVGTAAIGQTISKSGRTTGFTDGGTVVEAEAFGRILDADNNPRFVYGFGVDNLVADHGDSGGAVYSDTTALGVLSGGSPADATHPAYVFAADLQNNLAHTDGYTVRLFIDAPIVTNADGSDVERGGAISGTAVAGTTLTVTPATGSSFDVVVDAAGNWSFPAPNTLGDYDFTVQATSGFDESVVVEASVNVVLAPLAAPVVTAPGNDSDVANQVTELTGTGLPGATINVTGDVEGTTTVAADGTWTLELDEPLGYGDYAVSVSQSTDEQTSPATAVAFSVVLPAPVITTPANGSSFDLTAAPSAISGTGLDGATVQVTLSGEALAPVTVVDGKWTAAIDYALIAGDYTVIATQTVDTVISADAVSGFSLTIAPAPVDPGTPSGPADDGTLASTGFDGLPFLGGAAALLLVGGGALFLMRRRSVTE